LELVSAWHASIGKAILENWGFAGEMSEAVGNQDDRDRSSKRRQDADLSDIMIAGLALADARKLPVPRVIDVNGIGAFSLLGLTAQDCEEILTLAGKQLGLLQEALG
jgi:HD-like signal output (HDOD) protein